MRRKVRAVLCSLLVVVPVAAFAPETTAKGRAALGDACPPAFLLASRGSGDKEARDEGIGRPELVLKTRLSKLVPGLQPWANPYPAVGVFSWPWKHFSQLVNGAGAVTKLSGLGLGAYHDSAVKGTTSLAAKAHQVILDCGGKSAIILAGYSQGAQVTADVYQRDLSPSERSSVTAVVLFGDPYFNGGDRSVDRGSFSGRRDGILGKRPTFGSNGHTLILSYCHSHDPICQGVFFRVGPTRTLDVGALTTLQHKNYDRLGEPEQAAKAIAQLIAAPPSGGSSVWPTKRDDGTPAFFIYLGASFISPDWSSCSSHFCIVGSGDTVYVFSIVNGINQVATLPLATPSPTGTLARMGMPAADIAVLFRS